VRAAVPPGSVFLEGNGVDGPLVEVRRDPAPEPVEEPIVVQPAVTP
jgi:hypothetical protein